MAYATGSTGLAITVRGSSRRIMIMRFRPANIRLINRRSNLLRLLLALSSGKNKSKDNDKNNPTYFAVLTWSLHIRPMRSLRALGSSSGPSSLKMGFWEATNPCASLWLLFVRLRCRSDLKHTRLVHKLIFIVARCDVVKDRMTLLDQLAAGSMQVAKDVMPYIAFGNCSGQRFRSGMI